MNVSRKTLAIALTASIAVTVGCAAGLGWMYQTVRAYERKNKVSVLVPQDENIVRNNSRMQNENTVRTNSRKKDESAIRTKPLDGSQKMKYTVREGDDIVSIAIKFGVSPSKLVNLNSLEGDDCIRPGDVLMLPADAQLLDEADAGTNVVAKIPPQLKVLEVKYDGDTSLDLRLSEQPDMDVVRRYVRVAPMGEGIVGFRYDKQYNYRSSSYEPHLIISGEFAFRTNMTLVVRKGLPLHGRSAGLSAEGSLAEDFVYTFRRKDRVPYVRFANEGRYLPPGGRHALAVESVNVTKIHSEICRVAPQNVVQMLAREEGVYERHNRHEWRAGSEEGADNADTGELAEEATERDWSCANRLNEKETTSVPVVPADGGATNGIYLVAVRNGDKPRNDISRWEEGRDYANPNRYRLVCLTDIGLSVRQSGDETGVWATSFTTGRPVAGCRIDVFSTANIKVAEGVTDTNGWCAVRRVAKGNPFVVVATSSSGDDMSFLALRDSMEVDETFPEGYRPDYLAPNECTAFVWTERGIYRHDEPIFLHAILRDGTMKAPKPFPVDVLLRSPNGNVYSRRTLIPDENGAISCDTFRVPADQQSGKWTFNVRLPGKNGVRLGERTVKIEEFAPPQIRVAVEPATNVAPQQFAFTVKAEHLYGGPASSLSCEGAVNFEDVPFEPNGWKGFHFGNDDLGLNPAFRTIEGQVLDAQGTTSFAAGILAESGSPKAAVRATAQGVVFEDGGRPVASRASVTCHFYPYYIGATLPEWLRMPERGQAQISIACVTPDGKRLAEGQTLRAKIERIDSVYAYRKNDNGWHSWDCERVRAPVSSGIPVVTYPDKDAEFKLPLYDCGEYVLTIEDEARGVSFARSFYLSQWGDDTVRAPLGNPTAVSIRPDKTFYRVGETPRLLVKAPFAGAALVSVMRDGPVYTQVLDLTNATSEVCLRPVERDWAPNVDVTISVVQSVAENAGHLAVRAHGQVAIPVRPVEYECPVKVSAKVETGNTSGATVTVDLDARGAAATGTVAVVTVVDEGINILTDEKTPDPVGCFAKLRSAIHPLYDLYGRMLPVIGGDVRKSGVKTGGGADEDMFRRVSPVPTRRFKPLALWQDEVPLTGGCAHVVFKLPEFVGEVRVTAVAWSDSATGAGSVQRKVTPNLVMQPDAPRFVAPGDEFEVSLPLANRSGADGEVQWEIRAEGCVENIVRNGSARIADGGKELVTATVRAGKEPGQGKIVYTARGLGETHTRTIEVPVRPAVAWRERAGTARLEPGQKRTFAADGSFARQSVTVDKSSLGELTAALEWLADYPHGCLEQTSSRIFPLVTAGGILNAVGSRAATNRAEYVAAGVRRVESMIRAKDFVMWPDCNYAPWDREVSLYASHFLIAAEKSGQRLNQYARSQVMGFLRKWAVSTNDMVSAYACHTLALAGEPDRDRMFRLYDKSAELSPLSRARLARAFVAIHDFPRAESLLKGSLAPTSVREAAFAVLALLDLNPDDERVLPLVRYLTTKRDPARFSWGTTGENAHALLAIGAYSRHHPPMAGTPRVRVKAADGMTLGEIGNRETVRADSAKVDVENIGLTDAFVSWKTLELPPAESVTNEASGIAISRAYFTADGKPADLAKLRRGELLQVELTLASDVRRTFSDLVIEDLFAGAFEPVHREIAAEKGSADWVMRKDARDDRMLVFSKQFSLDAGQSVKMRYPVRVVSAGDFVLPGPSVEAMYFPTIRARLAPSRLSIRF